MSIIKAHKTLITLFLLSSMTVFSQQVTTHKLDWEISKVDSKSCLNVVGFGPSLFSLPKYVTKIKVPNTKELAVELDVIESVNLTRAELATLSVDLKNKINSAPVFSVNYGTQVKVKYGLVSIVPIFKSNGVIKKLTSFKLSASFLERASQETISVGRSSRSFKGTSVLAEGDYFKLALKANGIYKVTYEYLEENGALSSSVSSSLINLYGNHNGMLPERNGDWRVDDLEKNAIKLVDGGDGTFGEGDYFLFYGQSPDKWDFNSAQGRFFFNKHLYTEESFFFLNVNDMTGPKRISSLPSSPKTVTNTVTTFNDYQAREDEDINIMSLSSRGGSGKLWVGDVFDAKLSYNYNFSFPNIDASTPANVYSAVLALTPYTNSTFSLSSGGQSTSIGINRIPPSTHSSAANKGFGSISFNPSSSTIGVNLTYNKPNGESAVGYLDYIEVNVRRNLIVSSNQLIFRDMNSVGIGNISKFDVGSASAVSEVWDVTNPFEIKSIQFNRVSGNADFTVETDSLKTFIAYKNNGFLVPDWDGAVANQNLHAEDVPDMMIVFHPAFETQVDQLIDFHESNGLSVLKANVQQIYNEFSGGAQDVTAIKTFAKMFYDRGGSNPPKYLLLFGDGSYDYKGRVQPNQNFVPVYESDNSLSDITSFVTDDYYGLLDDGEAIADSDLLDIAVGRLTVSTTVEAQNVVNKIINYQRKNVPITEVQNCGVGTNAGTPYGDWRNNLCFVSDDIDDPGWEWKFIEHNERMADSVEKNHKSFNLQKVHMDAYKQTSVSGGERYLDGTEVLRRTVENGALVTTYIGHGGEVGWGSERFLDLSTINGWTNKNRLTVMLTATCEFTKYDDPSRTSAGELCLLNKNGGAIALFTTTRPVFEGANKNLISAFFDEVFIKHSNGAPRTLGEIYMETKNSWRIAGTNDHRRFSLIGDPALNLAFPKNSVQTTEVNNVPVSGNIDTLKALSKITIKGFVSDVNGTILSDYDGVVFPTVYDKPLTLSTLGNRDISDARTYDLQRSILYKGKASVKNGQFEFTFLVPKDINYQLGYGKISYYCYDGAEDGTGYFDKISIGGVNTDAKPDNDGPVVGLYMNDKNFVSGGITDESPSIYAEIFDSSGINTSGNGIGHNLTAILDEKTNNPLILNNYYEADLDSYQNGKINYPLFRLEEGNHTLSFKSWDVHNNSSDNTIEFVVVESAELAIEHVLNYPNPFTTRTQFFFEHNQTCEFLEVQIQVFTVSGKLVKTINEPVKTHGFRVDAIEWDGRDDFGDRIGRGTYIYKVKVTDDGGNKVEKYEKLVLLK
ncbi:MAG: type IX secretion system sortase PorU [Flavobacteriales bacterium]